MEEFKKGSIKIIITLALCALFVFLAETFSPDEAQALVDFTGVVGGI